MAKKEETIKVSDERKKALEMAIEKIEKDFGKGSIMCLGEKAGVNVESISTGALPLDMALGIGGVPRGRIIEIYGPESGKQHSPSILLQKHKKKAVLQLMSMLNMLWTRNMPKTSG